MADQDIEIRARDVCKALFGDITPSVVDAIAQAIQEERDRCASVCESMVVVGRAWAAEQEVAAKALMTAAEHVRKGTKP